MDKKSKTYAAIDIGSNAVRLLIKRYPDKGEPEKLLLLRVPLRLGFDVFRHGCLSGERVRNLLRLMKAYRQLLRIYEVDRLRACATSAMRDASNGPEVIAMIKEKTGIPIEIISGAEEARIVYDNHLEFREEAEGDFIYVDVGGGSTETNFLHAGRLEKSYSYDIGTVRLLTDGVSAEQWDQLKSDMSALHRKHGIINIIGSGGNINRLYKMARIKDAEKKLMPVFELERMYAELAPMSVQERMDRYGLKPDRADVIVPAARIFLTIARRVGADYIIVPVIGVADGIIDRMAAG